MIMLIIYVICISLGLVLVFWGCFIVCDLVRFIVWSIIRLNGRSDIMTFLFDGMSLLFMVFLFLLRFLIVMIVYFVI
jgi:NADH-ubiquinone oxidoreductase chain 5